jgi:hypothetical protein
MQMRKTRHIAPWVAEYDDGANVGRKLALMLEESHVAEDSMQVKCFG